MSHEGKYYGLYRGVVVDNKDPKKLGRLKIQVPQVSGEEVTDWAWPVLGGVSQFKPVYGEWQEDASQSAAAINTGYPVRFTVDDGHYGMSMINNSKIKFAYKGIYNIQFSFQFENPTNDVKDITIWLRKNGVNVPGSAGVASIPSSHGGVPGRIIAAWNYVLSFEATDYFEIMWQTTDTDVIMKYYPSSTHPSAASSIITISSVGRVTPIPKDGVWVSYEGGDTNFPLWIGTF